MHELSCPACNTPSQYDFNDFILMCPFCSSSFQFDQDSGLKEIYTDHFIVPNTLDMPSVRNLAYEWLRRMHHKPGAAEHEFYITDITGFSCPVWIVSVEAHTLWRGLVKRKFRNRLDDHAGADYLSEHGQFRRSYRWAVSARQNICESWGMTRLHQPKEAVKVTWDGFPLDSTLSRGVIEDPGEKNRSAYDVREFFEFKYANGIPILGVQIDEDEGLRRAKLHIELYHYELCRLNVDYLVDYRTELEIAGIQLLHLPFWHTKYLYRPKSALRYFYRSKEKNILCDGYAKAVLKSELALVQQDKVMVNAVICGIAGTLFMLLGLLWHPAFVLVALFAFLVAGVSSYISISKRESPQPDKFVVHGGLSSQDDDREALPSAG